MLFLIIGLVGTILTKKRWEKECGLSGGLVIMFSLTLISTMIASLFLFDSNILDYKDSKMETIRQGNEAEMIITYEVVDCSDFDRVWLFPLLQQEKRRISISHSVCLN